jgi:hypothetical protein
VAAASGLGFRDTARRVRIGLLAVAPGRRAPIRGGWGSSAESESLVSPSGKGSSSSGLGSPPPPLAMAAAVSVVLGFVFERVYT